MFFIRYLPVVVTAFFIITILISPRPVFSEKKAKRKSKKKGSSNIGIQKVSATQPSISNLNWNPDRAEADVEVSGSNVVLSSNKTAGGGLACQLTDYTCIQEKYSVEFIFPTTLMYHKIVVDQKTFRYNEDIKRIMLDLEMEDDGCKFNLHGGYRSKDGFLDRPEEPIVWLRAQIEQRVRLMLALAGAGDTPFFIDGWGAVLRGNHGQAVHVHPQSM